jgi:hypothetical protein
VLEAVPSGVPVGRAIAGLKPWRELACRTGAKPSRARRRLRDPERRACGGEAIQLPDPVAYTSKPVEAPKVAREKPKPIPVHIEAAVTISSASEVDQYDESEGDWSDFDPEAWSRGEDYPEHLYEPVRLYDDVWELRPRADLQELPKLDVPPEIQSPPDEKQRLKDEIDALLETHGLNRMVWSQETLDLETV